MPAIKPNRESRNRASASESPSVIESHELPGKVTVRNLRKDVYREALKVAESTLRSIRRDAKDSVGSR